MRRIYRTQGGRIAAGMQAAQSKANSAELSKHARNPSLTKEKHSSSLGQESLTAGVTNGVESVRQMRAWPLAAKAHSSHADPESQQPSQKPPDPKGSEVSGQELGGGSSSDLEPALAGLHINDDDSSPGKESSLETEAAAFRNRNVVIEPHAARCLDSRDCQQVGTCTEHVQENGHSASAITQTVSQQTEYGSAVSEAADDGNAQHQDKAAAGQGDTLQDCKPESPTAARHHSASGPSHCVLPR